MDKLVIATFGSIPVVLMDSMAQIGAQDDGCIAVSGSHGGRSAAEYAAAHRPLLCVFNDAGVGCEGAGVAGLDLLQTAGIPALAVSHESARIGEARDTWSRGRISHVNAAARTIGIRVGASLREELARVFDPPA